MIESGGRFRVVVTDDRSVDGYTEENAILRDEAETVARLAEADAILVNFRPLPAAGRRMTSMDSGAELSCNKPNLANPSLLVC